MVRIYIHKVALRYSTNNPRAAAGAKTL